MLAAIQAIRDFYQIGASSLKTQTKRMAYGRMNAEAANVGLSEEMLRKARKFASPRDGGFTKAQMEQLCKQCVKHGFAIGVSHVIVLLSVPKDRRLSIQRDAIAGQWSRARLEVEKKKRFGKRSNTAKTPTPPATLEDAYVRLADLCGQWKRYYESMLFQIVPGAKSTLSSTLDDFPARFREKLELVSVKIEELEREASKLMSQRRGRRKTSNHR